MWYRLRRFAGSLDPLLLWLALALLATGWALVYSATLPPGQDELLPLPMFTLRQSRWIALGLVALVAGAAIDYHVLLRLAPWFYGAGLFLLTLVLGVGHTSFGARRWFVLGETFLQPSEFAKLGVLLLSARVVAASSVRLVLGRPAWRAWLPSAVAVVGVPMALILGQPNLGTALLLFVGGVAVWTAAGLPWSWFGGTGLASTAAAPFAWAFLKDYQRSRILNFLNPYQDPLGGGYTVIQSTTAIASGGWLGRGWTHGPQNRMQFIPKHHTDFIVSVLGEEFGWVGCAALLLAYALLYLQGLRIAQRARDLVGAYLAAGIVALLAFQTIVNLGMNVGVVPVTGLPLPLLSYGGSSLVVNCFLLGILLNIGRQHRH